MTFICEIVPSSYLTPLRRNLAQELSKSGMTQAEIGNILGVSQPVVSSYLAAELGSSSAITEKNSFQQLLSRLVKRIQEEKHTEINFMEEVCTVCQNFRTAGPLCEIHRKSSGISFSPDCSLCFPSESSRKIFDEKLTVTKELFETASILVESGEKFAQLIPEVGCQFVSIIEDSHDPTDIAGFPGRIVKVKNKGKIVSYPEFGEGATLAQILQYFREQSAPFHALISIRRTDEILEKISSSKEVLLTVEADKDWNQTLRSYSSQEIRKIEIIADAGGYGLEPLIYLFGKTPTDIVEFLLSKF
ncbi:MAG: thiamine-phosphate synthase family protein [Candidatus Hodarchaeales archaeon]|jgi:predicted fused transcriptional regulator/phosphomethylpyrimidine kinase/predicted transcriptional regulator